MPGSNNDINVLKSSNLFSKFAQGTAPPSNYTIQGKEYNMGYYLADGIYPKWSTTVQTISDPQGPNKSYLQQDKKHVGKMVNKLSEFYLQNL